MPPSGSAVPSHAASAALARVLELQPDQLYPLICLFRNMNVVGLPHPVREINDTKLRNRDSPRVGGYPDLAATRAHAPSGSRRYTLRLDFGAISLKIFLTLRRVKQKRRGRLELLLQVVRLAADLQIPDYRPPRKNTRAFWFLRIAAPLFAVDGLDSALQRVCGHHIFDVEVLQTRFRHRYECALFLLALYGNEAVGECNLRSFPAAGTAVVPVRRIPQIDRGILMAKVLVSVGEPEVSGHSSSMEDVLRHSGLERSSSLPLDGKVRAGDFDELVLLPA